MTNRRDHDMPRTNRFAAATAIAVVFSMTAASASATELARPHAPVSVQAYDADANTAENRRWRRHHRHGGGIDGGDILAGVLILGGIAAIASAADNDRDREYRDYPPPPTRGEYEERYDYRDAPQPYQGSESSTGLGRAADICTDAIERTIDPVGSVDSVRRGAAGWDVDGTLRDGSPFSCSIGSDGQIRDIKTDREFSGASYEEGGNPDESYGDGSYDDQTDYDEQSSADGQYDDDTYARVRAQQEGTDDTGG
jgi:hypothetical protein